MRHIYYSLEAHENLYDIFSYTADKWGIEQAKKYYDKISDIFLTIAKNPEIGCKNKYLAEDYYSFPIGNHLIIYRFTQSDLHIVAIMHMSMDIKKRLIKLLKKIKI